MTHEHLKANLTQGEGMRDGGVRKPLVLVSLTLAIAAITMVGATAKEAEARGKFPLVQQVTHNTTGSISDLKLRSEKANLVTFTSTGDVMGAGTTTGHREIYLYNVESRALQRVTHTTGGESHSPSKVTDITFPAGRPTIFMFVSNGDHDPANDNSDGNDEIFLYEVDTGKFHQLTDTQPPATNMMPWASDSGKCLVFVSSGDLEDNPGDSRNPGNGFRNPDGSLEVYHYTIANSNGYPTDGYFTQMSNGPAGTASTMPVMGGYWFPRQCQTTAFLSDADQTGHGGNGTRIYLYKRPSGDLLRFNNRDVVVHNELDPDGFYGRPHISTASNFARGPYVVFSTNADMWNNKLAKENPDALNFYRFRVFHERMTQWGNTNIPGDTWNPQISDGGGWFAFQSTGELFNPRKGAKNGDPGPFNADHNSEIFEMRGRRQIWQITRTSGCTNNDPQIQDNGRSIAFTSTCDLVPGKNPNGVEQVFLWRRLKKGNPLLAAGACTPNGNSCCGEIDGCWVDLKGAAIKPPRRNASDKIARQ